MKNSTANKLIYIGILSLSLLNAGCVSTGTSSHQGFWSQFTSNNASMYASKTDGAYVIPEIPYQKIPPQYLRKRVSYPTHYPEGTLIVDTKNYFLYYIEGHGKAMRYGIGVGKAGFTWSGKGYIGRKTTWPAWTPPAAMVQRDPHLKGVARTFPPGLNNPLGARALYIFNEKGDTLYRVHGSPEWWSIGKNISSGCIRLLNQDIIDLYDRVKVNSKIIVL